MSAMDVLGVVCLCFELTSVVVMAAFFCMSMWEDRKAAREKRRQQLESSAKLNRLIDDIHENPWDWKVSLTEETDKKEETE